MSKVYTAQEMREFAKLYYARGKTIREFCARRGGAVMFTVFPSEGISDRKVASMLIQAADLLEREAAKDAEIARLRALVKGLLDASSISCADCKYDCYSDHSNCIIHDAANYIEEIEVK